MYIKRHFPATILLGLLFAIAFGCSDSGDSPTSPGGGNQPTVSFATDIRDTLIARCAKSGCHGSGFSQGGYSMGDVSWDSIRAASGFHGPIIVPGNASASNMYLKTTASPPFLQRMPADGTTLSIQAQFAIRDWINQGALDN